MQRKHPRCEEKVDDQRHVAARSVPACALQQQATTLAEAIEQSSPIDANYLITIVNELLIYINTKPKESFNIDATDDVARCAYCLITHIIDFGLFAEAQPVIHNELEENTEKLEVFFKSNANNMAYQFEPILIKSLAAIAGPTSPFSYLVIAKDSDSEQDAMTEEADEFTKKWF